ncbi:MAG TPA: hypothetical protein VH186_25250 [Chloroflexia bacterium]|nr:hypothetical protein [Chloroflexia bacterium]
MSSIPGHAASQNRAFSLELGDKGPTPSNHTQTRNLRQASGPR